MLTCLLPNTGYCALRYVLAAWLYKAGDLLHGDANGVTNIPMELASEVADVAEEFVTAENHVLEYVKASGAKDISALAAKRAAMSEAMAALRRRISRK